MSLGNILRSELSPSKAHPRVGSIETMVDIVYDNSGKKLSRVPTAYTTIQEMNSTCDLFNFACNHSGLASGLDYWGLHAFRDAVKIIVTVDVGDRRRVRTTLTPKYSNFIGLRDEYWVAETKLLVTSGRWPNQKILPPKIEIMLDGLKVRRQMA